MIATLLIAATCFLPGTRSDSWSSPKARVEISENGQYAVALEITGRGSRYSFVHRATRPSLSGENVLRSEPARLLKEAGFEAPHLLGAGSLGHVPLDILVSDNGHGFAALDRHYGNRSGKVLVTVNAKGAIQGSWSLEAVLGGDAARSAPFSLSSVPWRRSDWIDETSGQLVLAGLHGVIVAELASPVFRAGGVEDVIRGLSHGGTRGKVGALDYLAVRRLPQLAPRYVELLDPVQPMPVRLRAGWALSLFGDLQAAELFLDVALNESPSPAVTLGDREFALKQLHRFADVDVLPQIRAALRGRADDLWHARQRVFVELGEASIPILLEMLAETEESPDYRGGSAHALREIGSTKALDGLLTAVRSPNRYVANAALNAAIGIDAKGLAPKLLDLVQEETTQTSRLVSHFSKHAYPPSIEVLESLLAGEADESLQRSLNRALVFQRKPR